MRFWLLAMMVGLFPGIGGQDRGVAPAPAVPTAPVAAPHAICGGDTLAPKHPVILTGYGKGGFPITTAKPRAQAFFDNGMQLGHAFAHAASIAAFHEAAALDPTCAMCLWGEAWASGPTINYDKTAREVAPLAALTARAALLATAHGTDRERALIAALALRYKDGGGKAGNLAFARAMDALVGRYPDDDEIATLAADAWLIAPWKPSDRRYPWRAIALLEGVLKRDPDYTPAIHFYIHATEMVEQPGRAEPYADRLTALAPSASHLVHMPSHTYYWIGRYQDAADANMRAVALGIANAKRLGLPMPDGVWGLPYHAHNVVYGLGGALMSGDAKDALALGRPLVARSQGTAKAPPFAQLMAASGYFAEGRFADPAEVLALPEPKLPFLKGYWHYARGEALARQGDAARVRVEAAAIPETVGHARSDDGSDAATRMLRISRQVLLGRAAMLDGRPDEALAAFRKATADQESHIVAGFSDPPAWWYPVRRSMSEAMLARGDARGALHQADLTLKQRPRDPVTLAVRARAEATLGQLRSAALDRGAALATWRGDRRMLRAALS